MKRCTYSSQFVRYDLLGKILLNLEDPSWIDQGLGSNGQEKFPQQQKDQLTTIILQVQFHLASFQKNSHWLMVDIS